MKDKTLFCIQCDDEFVFSVAEQQRFDRMGFDEPRRCPACRKHKTREEEGDERRRQKGKKRRHNTRLADDF